MVVEDLMIGEGHVKLVGSEVIAGDNDAARPDGVDVAALYGTNSAPGNGDPVARAIADMRTIDLYIVADPGARNHCRCRHERRGRRTAYC